MSADRGARPTAQPGASGEPPGVERHRGQLRIAERLAAGYAERLLYVRGAGWHTWDGARWAPDDRGHATRAVVATLKRALAEAAQMPSRERDALHNDVRRCESAAGVDGVLRLASAHKRFAATVADLDGDAHLLNTASGTLKLDAGQLRAHHPGDRITKLCGAGYDPAAVAPGWEKFLAEALPDPAVREFLRRLIGLSLLGKVVEHVLPIFTGAGRNGKGVFVRTVSAALGDYAIEAEPELFLARDRAHPTGQLDLRGVRLATCQETDDGKRLAVATVKRLSGGDTIRARAMRQDFVQFTPSHTPLLTTNHLPKVPADDPALWARLLVVPWGVSFLGREDTGLGDRLALELPGVLRWAVSGYEDYQRRRLDPPAAVKVATERYRLTSDALAQFLADRCLTAAPYYVRSSDLWQAWQAWTRDNNEHPGNQRELKDALETRGHKSRRTNSGVVFGGLALAAEHEEEP